LQGYAEFKKIKPTLRPQNVRRDLANRIDSSYKLDVSTSTEKLGLLTESATAGGKVVPPFQLSIDNSRLAPVKHEALENKESTASLMDMAKGLS
jgi:hypothetical protein